MSAASQIFPPRSLSDVVGHAAAIEGIRRRFASGEHKIPLMLYGPAGIGRGTIARLYAKALLCEQARADEMTSCGVCDSCRAFDANSSFGYLDFEAKKIKNPREMFQEKLRDSAFVPKRAVVIHNPEDATPNFMDVILKAIEDGSKNTLFIFVATDINGVRAAGQSRSVTQRLRPLIDEDMQRFCQAALASIGCPTLNEQAMQALIVGGMGKPARVVEALQVMARERITDVRGVARVLGIDWGDQAIGFCEALLNPASSPLDGSFSVTQGYGYDVWTSRIRQVLALMPNYFERRAGAITESDKFNILRPDALARVADAFNARAAHRGVSATLLWEGVSELYFREDYSDAAGFGLAGREARDLLQM